MNLHFITFYIQYEGVSTSTGTSDIIEYKNTSSTRNTSIKQSETDTNSKSISEEYLCSYIDSENNIKPQSVPEKFTTNVFFTSTVSDDKNEKEKLDSEEIATANGTNDVHFFDDFDANVDDDDDNYS